MGTPLIFHLKIWTNQNLAFFILKFLKQKILVSGNFLPSPFGQVC